MISSIVPERSCPAGGSGPRANAEHNGGCKRYKWQDCSGPSHGGSGGTRNNRGQGRVDAVNKPEPMAYEAAGQNKTDDAGGECDNDLQHIEFPD